MLFPFQSKRSLSHIIVLVGAGLIVIFLSLANWQYQRAKYKELLTFNLQQRALADHVFIDNLANFATGNHLFKKVTLYGQLLFSQTILLDNQIYKGRPGFRVLVPLVTSDNQAVLIDRGFLVRENSREQLPKFNEDDVTIKIDGMFINLSSGISLGVSDWQASYPKLIQNLDYISLSTMLGYTLVPHVLRLEEMNSLSYDYPPINFGVPSNTHYGYSIQWLSLAIVTGWYCLRLYRRS